MEFEVDVLRNKLDGLKVLGKKDREELLFESVVNKKDIKVVEELLKLGTDANIKNNDNDTPLVLACDKGNVKAVKLLVRFGANVNYTGSMLGTPLYLACQSGSIAFVEYLVQKGANVNDASNYDKETPIFQACRILNKDLVKFLIKSGANVNVANSYGITPISLICKYVGKGQEQESQIAFRIAKLLVRSGANLNVVEKDETTPLLIASEYRNSKLVVLLVENGAVVKSSYNRPIKQFIQHTVDNMYPSLEKRLEIKEALMARDVESFKTRLMDYLEFEEFEELEKLCKEDNHGECITEDKKRRIHDVRKYMCWLEDGKEFREVVRELISSSKHDNGELNGLNDELKLCKIYRRVKEMQLILKDLESEKCCNMNKDEVEKAGKYSYGVGRFSKI